MSALRTDEPVLAPLSQHPISVQPQLQPQPATQGMAPNFAVIYAFLGSLFDPVRPSSVCTT